ncbi:hypothetical protein VLK31_28250 [Variovorax sp. H27-G14]|uniref:hypothetical protein n=1 Tax=Variovorax sp. H27-G14 TaxID=3111914 RepID=UPI0038FC9C23
MPGVKGRSGGARPGAGRPKKDPADDLTIATSGEQTPAEFLATVMNSNMVADKLRIDAAKALLSAEVRRAENSGKKEAKAAAAKTAGAGKFASAAPPKLVAAGGRKV